MTGYMYILECSDGSYTTSYMKLLKYEIELF